MQPLTKNQKELAYGLLVRGKIRVVARPLYLVLLNLELAAHRLADSFFKPGEVRDVTALIKTFERPERCRALIRSIRKFYPNIPIVVVDDSRIPKRFSGAITHTMQYDCGVSAGRREGLNLVSTKYVINLDDDYVFFRHTNLPRVLSILNRIPEIDIIGGVHVDLPLYIKQDSKNGALWNTASKSLRPQGSRVGNLEVCDKVANFFVGRTEKIISVNWDSAVRRLDHADFFTRCKGKLVSVTDPSFHILHVRNPYEFSYRKIRYDLQQDLAYLEEKYS